MSRTSKRVKNYMPIKPTKRQLQNRLDPVAGTARGIEELNENFKLLAEALAGKETKVELNLPDSMALKGDPGRGIKTIYRDEEDQICFEMDDDEVFHVSSLAPASIEFATINEDGELVIHYSDDREEVVGVVTQPVNSIDDIYFKKNSLYITTSDGEVRVFDLEVDNLDAFRTDVINQINESHRDIQEDLYEKIDEKMGKVSSQVDLFIKEHSVVTDFLSSVTPEYIRDNLSSLRGDDRIDVSAVKGLEEMFTDIKKNVNRLARGVQIAGGGASLLDQLNDVATGGAVLGDALIYQSDGTWAPGAVVSPLSDQLKVSAADTTRGYLDGKLTVSGPITKTIVNPGGNETLNLAMPVATSSVDGYLDNADWTTFNNKEEVLSFTSPLSRTGNTVTTSMATNKLIGRGTAGTGVFEEITLGTGLSFTGTTLNATGTIDGSGTTNELTYWVDSNTIGALPVATYPSLTELSYGKGVTSAIQTQIDGKLSDTGDTGTGAYDFGGATTFEIPNSATPTLNTTGQIAVDTTVTDFTNGLLKYYSTAEYGVVAMPIASFTSPTNGYVVAYNSANDAFELVAQSGGGGGGITIGTTTITSGTANRVLIHSATGDTVQEDSGLIWDFTQNKLSIVGTSTVPISSPSSGTLYVGAYPASIVSPNNGTALGIGAGSAVTTSANFALFGYNAGATLTTQITVVAFGSQAFLNAAGTAGIAVGYNSQANNSSPDCTSIGSTTMVSATGVTGSVVIGKNSGAGFTTGFWDTVIGTSTAATSGASYGNVIIGYSAGATVGGSFGANRNTIVGYTADADAGLTGTIALGAGAIAKTSNTIVIGGTITAPTRVYFGLGETSATATAITLSATGGVGTDKAGGNFTLAGGQPSGSGTPGYVYVSTADVGATGTTLRALVQRTRHTSTYFESLTSGSFAMPFAAGSASAPTYSVLGDTNTGDYSSAADNWDTATGGTRRLNIDANGNIRAFTLHDNATAQGSATQQDIRSGTYTPTLTGVTNVSSSTARKCQWMRVGNVVTVSGQMEITATANNAQTTIGISLPVSSNFGTAYECGGAANTMANTVAGHGGAIYADATNDRAELDYYETHGAADVFAFSFTYEVI